MAGSFTAVDLSKLPKPPILEAVSAESLRDQMLAKLQEFDSSFTAILPSDPAYKILEVCAYFRVLDRQRVNDAALGVLLAYARDGDLDNLGALVGVQRLVLDEGNPSEGIPPTMELDADLRRRIQLAPEGFSVAGPEGAYIFHALSADSRMLDASATSSAPDDIRQIVMDVLTANSAAPGLVADMNEALDLAVWPGDVVVSVLSRDGDGAADAGLIEAVDEKLSSGDVRPLTDHVMVQSAEIVPYTVVAEIFTYAGPDSAVVMAAAMDRIEKYVAENHRIGRDVSISGIYAALHVEGVQRVELTSPTANIPISGTQASYCTSIDVTHGGVGD
jgi:phage-related baseplate assembly protein